MAADNPPKPSEAPVALVTGGASGMGLATVEWLIQQGWNITIADLNEETGQQVAQRLGEERIVFIKVDVTDYEQQANAFVKTWRRWQRLDFVYANAGIGDRINFTAPVEDREDGAPPKPNTEVVDVCLYGAMYTAYLALHYFRKNENKSGKLIFTSSLNGLFSGVGIPLYTAAKHGVVALARVLGQRLARGQEPITVNCICPGLVATPLTTFLTDLSPEEYTTPASTIVKAVEGFLSDSSKTGMAAECSGTNIYFKTQPDYGDEKSRWVMENPPEVLAEEKLGMKMI